MMMRLAPHARHLCLLRPIAVLVVLAINIAHPFMHSFEGGSLDAMLVYLDQWALTLSTVPVDES